LDLTDEGCVALEKRDAHPGRGVPDPDGRVESARRDADPIECDRVYLVKMAYEDV
jgi:hypothetical protein